MKDAKKEKRKMIAENALLLIKEKGLNNFTMEDLAEKSKISKGSIYNYYVNKNAVIIASFGILTERLSRYLTYSSEINEEEEAYSPEIFSKKYYAVLESFPSNDLLKLIEIMISSLHDKALLKDLTDIFTKYYSELMSTFEKVFHSKTKAVLFQSMLDGLALYKAVGVKISFDEIEEDFKNIVEYLKK